MAKPGVLVRLQYLQMINRVFSTDSLRKFSISKLMPISLKEVRKEFLLRRLPKGNENFGVQFLSVSCVLIFMDLLNLLKV